MDFNYTPEQEKFRADLRAFLEKTFAGVFGRGGDGLDDSSEIQHNMIGERVLHLFKG